MATKRDEMRQGLTAAQALALDALDTGANLTMAAEVAGVHRATVSRWVNDPGGPFHVAMMRRRAERSEAIANAAEALTLAALDVVAGAIAEGDRVTALRWLTVARAGAFVAPPVPVEAEPITNEMLETKIAALIALTADE